MELVDYAYAAPTITDAPTTQADRYMSFLPVGGHMHKMGQIRGHFIARYD